MNKQLSCKNLKVVQFLRPGALQFSRPTFDFCNAFLFSLSLMKN